MKGNSVPYSHLATCYDIHAPPALMNLDVWVQGYGTVLSQKNQLVNNGEYICLLQIESPVSLMCMHNTGSNVLLGLGMLYSYEEHAWLIHSIILSLLLGCVWCASCMCWCAGRGYKILYCAGVGHAPVYGPNTMQWNWLPLNYTKNIYIVPSNVVITYISVIHHCDNRCKFMQLLSDVQCEREHINKHNLCFN